jgi:hypothetical protein
MKDNILKYLFNKRKDDKVDMKIDLYPKNIKNNPDKYKVYLIDNTSNRLSLSHLLGESKFLFDEYTYLEVDLVNLTWKNNPSFRWLYTNSPQIIDVERLKSLLEVDHLGDYVKSLDFSKSHNGVILCEYKQLDHLMPEVVPIIKDLINSNLMEYPIEDYLIDVKVHMLMKDQYPCIPNWHCDFVPRCEDGKKEPQRITGEKMYLWVSGEPKTEFRDKPKILNCKHTQWVEFTQNDLHRGVKSDGRTWRCFIRLVPKKFIEVRPTGNPDKSHRGSLRRHSQVYLDAASFEW